MHFSPSLRLVGNLRNRPSPGDAVTSVDPAQQSECVPVDMGTGRMFLVETGRWKEDGPQNSEKMVRSDVFLYLLTKYMEPDHTSVVVNVTCWGLPIGLLNHPTFFLGVGCREINCGEIRI